MIPLRSRETTKKFPTVVLVYLGLWVLAFLLSYLWPGSRLDFLNAIAPNSSQGSLRLLASIFFAPNAVSFVTAIFFVWAFVPRLFEWRRWWICTLVSACGCYFSIWLYFFIHPATGFRILSPESFYGVWLGMAMRREIWGGTETLVVGWGWARVYDVPSYVLLFFWLFYLLVANLLLSGSLAEAPMLYLLPLTALVWGFAAESLMPNPKEASPEN